MSKSLIVNVITFQYHQYLTILKRYNELSYKTAIHDSERLTALKNATICTILAAAGQPRSRSEKKLDNRLGCLIDHSEEILFIHWHFVIIQDVGNSVQRREVPAAVLLQYLGEDVSRQTYQAHRAHRVRNSTPGIWILLLCFYHYFSRCID